MCLSALTGNTAITWGWQSMAPMHLDSCDVYGAVRTNTQLRLRPLSPSRPPPQSVREYTAAHAATHRCDTPRHSAPPISNPRHRTLSLEGGIGALSLIVLCTLRHHRLCHPPHAPQPVICPSPCVLSQRREGCKGSAALG